MLKNVPNQFISGENLAWQKFFDEYLPGDGWVLRYSFRGTGPGFDVTAIADADAFILNVGSTVTAQCAAGKYFYQGFVEKGTEKYSVDSGECTVLPNLAAGSASTLFDGRSKVKIVLDNIDAMILGKATLDQQSYVIGNRQLVRIPISELMTLRDKYALLYAREKRAERIRQGGSFFKTVLVRMQEND